MRVQYLMLCLAACGGSQKPAPKEPVVSPKIQTRHVVEDDSEPTEGVTIVNGRGRMEVEAIQRGIAPHTEAMSDCYMSRVGKRRWLGGNVEIHWDISKDGVITAVKLSSSDLGAWPIEKCLLEIARNATFDKPIGGDADFELPLNFSPKGAGMPWDDDQSIKAVGGQMLASFGKCDSELGKPKKGEKKAPAPKAPPKTEKDKKPKKPAVPPEDVTVTLYVGAKGAAQSVGFASKASEVDDEWGDCAEKAALAWRLPDPHGQIAKLTVKYKPAASE